jgi:hypothetical protein
MRTFVFAASLPALIALILGAVVAWDRLREPHRDPTRPFVVVDPRTYQDAQQRITRLLAADDPTHARPLIHAICIWLRDEIHTGPSRRRVRRARELEQWELRLQDLAAETAPSGGAER